MSDKIELISMVPHPQAVPTIFYTDTSVDSAMLAMLKKLEWSGLDGYFQYSVCPSCHEEPPRHAADCELAAVLKAAEGGA